MCVKYIILRNALSLNEKYDLICLIFGTFTERRLVMRKFVKNQIIELLATIKDGISYVSSARKNNKKQAVNLLNDCFGAFEHVKATITTNLKKDRVLGYEKVIDDILNGIKLLIGNVSNTKKYDEYLDKLNLSILSFEKMLTDEPIRTEVVFLPYKASMWDSLESVWKAADEDENCDAYVIPIPYYDRNPDGSLREEHYEGKEFPKYVPITRYDGYDFEKRKPDMIFIHNPYDGGNFVTTVHPYFYSDKLKKFTEKLVYIPYFVLEEPDPEDEKAVEKISHFCTASGVINADQVIVQSENMRQVYIKVLYELGKEHGIKKEYWENKIVGSGSPKFDKVLGTKREDIEIPEEWMKIIKKPDGSWKKLIFYNTGLTALLEHKEKMIEKIKSVLKSFEENKDEIALLWRPHPLIPATINSMRPQLKDEYEKIVNDYKDAAWGIFDDTADNDRPIIISDAYYGDWSSMVTLYKKTGKPIMIQNVDIL